MSVTAHFLRAHTTEYFMKKMIFGLCLCLFCAAPAFADGLDTFLDNLNVQGAADRNGFVTSVSSHFGVPYSDVEMIVGTTGSLSDAFMVFQLGRMTGYPTDRIMRTYGSGKGKGWGAMAQELGIKPGSEEFHALKRGDFNYAMPQSKKGGGQGGSQGSGKGGGQGSDGNGKKNDQGKGKKK